MWSAQRRRKLVAPRSPLRRPLRLHGLVRRCGFTVEWPSRRGGQWGRVIPTPPRQPLAPGQQAQRQEQLRAQRELFDNIEVFYGIRRSARLRQ